MTPIRIDWEYFRTIRDSVVASGGIRYLLLPEVSALINNERGLKQRIAFRLMWLTGAHASEILKLSLDDFCQVDAGLYVTLSKDSMESSGEKGGRNRMIQRRAYIYNDDFVADLNIFKEHAILGTDQPVINVTRQTLTRWVHDRARKVTEIDPIALPEFPINPKTFRDSFAANAIIHASSLDQLQMLMGHRYQSSTLRYLSLFETTKRELLSRMQF